MFEKNLEVPQKEPADYVHTLVKAAIASMPKWWAASGAEIFSMVIASPIEKRRDEFLEDLAWVARETAARVENLQPEKLAQNDAFVSAVLYATRIAMSTHQREKREYLRNALVNVALRKQKDELREHLFLNAIEAFSPAHVQTLDLIWRGAGRKIPWDQTIPMNRRNYGVAIGTLIPELGGQPWLASAILGDLRNRGFSNLHDPEASFPQGSLMTNLGVEFLTFVLAPEDLPR